MKTKTIFFFLIFVCCGTNVFGQANNWLWARSAPGYGEGWAVCNDSVGNVFVTGCFGGASIQFGSTTLVNTGFNDVFIAKYDPYGNVLWAKSATTSSVWGTAQGTSVSTDPKGNVFITGFFGSPTITFDATTLINIDNSGNSGDVFIAKYSANGNLLWAESAGGLNGEGAYSVSSDLAGNAFIIGGFGSPSITFGSTTLNNSGIDNIFIVKYDEFGNVIWAKSAGGTNIDLGNSISADESGNAFVTGFFQSPAITLGATVLNNVGTQNVFIAKYDPNGNVLWAKSAVGTRFDAGMSVSADFNGDFFVAGYFTSPILTFDSTIINNADSLAYTHDVFIVKYDSNGNLLWAKSAGGTNDDDGWASCTDSLNNVYVTGGFKSAMIIFGSDTLLPPVSNCSPNPCDPMFFVKYDALGNVICSTALGSGGDDQAGVSADPFGNAYICGDYQASPFIIGLDTLQFFGGEEVFVAKYNCNIDAGVKEITNENPITISPNPFTTSTTIQFTTAPKNAELNIYNLYGQEIKTIKNISSSKIEIDRGDLSSGIYFVRLVEGNGVIGTGKIIVTD